MSDRSANVLENYEIEVLRTWKGRGAVLCETKQGILILKEYAGHRDKVVFQDALLHMIQEKGFHQVETIIRNKEQELLTQDLDGTLYILKTYMDGRECNVRDMEECCQASGTLAALHKVSRSEEPISGLAPAHSVYQEFQKHNKELRRVKKYLKDRGQKTDFEIALFGSYDYFLNIALETTEEMKNAENEKEAHFICHGDFQYHNIIVSAGEMHIINFEKCLYDRPVRDLYLFMRKLLEKSGWSEKVGFDLVESYEKTRPMEKEEYRQLYYRLAYPEKFWKIVNFYYNSGKAWIPDKNMEKLVRVTQQEKSKQAFLENFKIRYGLS